jgi:DNA-binding MarR family transcriptional regulator
MLTYIEGVFPERDLTAKSVAWRLRRASHHVDTVVKRRLSQQGMELWELEILCGLKRNDGVLTMGDLQDIAQLTSGAITNRVARLEREGWVRRDVDPVDRRQVLVTLTPAGAARSDEVVDANHAAELEAFATIPRDVQERLAGDLRELLLATEGPDPHTHTADEHLIGASTDH